ncbi:MAG TPA: L-threonylcarbamoyladenylate synthase, partial [Gemmatimonadales bacterium]|nr:L-threonylcarbamoyladenylate synthase [Gemmatimonadales bacterium]
MILPFTGAAVGESIPTVVAHLRKGGLIGYPTETVYGLGGNVSEDAVEGVARLKGREPGKPFLLIISEARMAEDLGLLFNASARALARAFWPGPLTLALPGGPRLPAMLRGVEGGVAVRHTGHKDLAALVAAFGEPITSTSANRPGNPPAPGAERLVEEFKSEVESGQLLVLDGGVLGRVPPSTLVDCTRSEPRLVREGAIPREELRR